MTGIVRLELPATQKPLRPGTQLQAVHVQNDLQGTPDNIRRHGKGHSIGSDGTYLVALGSARKAPFNLPQLLAPWPTLRRLASLLSLEATTALIPKVSLLS